MNNCFIFEQLTRFCDHLLAPFHSATLCNAKGQSLFLKYKSLSDIGTLPQATGMSHKYIPLKHGDIAITNDPYIGGSTLSSITLVMGLNSSSQNRTADLLVGVRIPFKPKISLSDNVENEGLRIPPTPIYQAGQRNDVILEAISGNPHSQAKFKLYTLQAIEQLKKVRAYFDANASKLDFHWSKSEMKDYFSTSNHFALELLHELRLGGAQDEIEVHKNALLKLNIDITETNIVFDFTGTDSSNEVFLTDTATLGTCIGALLALIDRPIPINSGLFELVEVRAPEGSIVHAKYPQPVFLGVTDGTSLIANFILKVLGAIDPLKQQAASGHSQCAFDIDFSENGEDKQTPNFYETLLPGAAASARKAGAHGVHIWTRSSLDPSIEEIERFFPLKVESFSFRPNSGGTGLYAGGNGITKSIRALAPGRLRWARLEGEQKPEGILGGKNGSSAEFIVQKENGPREKLPLRGELNLKTGDLITMHSSGGGGYGEEETEEPSE